MDEKMGRVSVSGVNHAVKQKFVFGKYPEKEWLMKLKALAVNHHTPGITSNSIRPLWDQTLRVREVMALTNFPQVRLLVMPVFALLLFLVVYSVVFN